MTQRNSNLRNAIAQLNSLLFNRMLSKGQFGLQQLSSHLGSMGAQGFPSQSIPSTDTRASLTLQEIVRNCPDVADHALHIPLQHCDEKVQRILRFVENECEVLPSKDRCPFLLVCEVIERPYLCKSDRLYATAQSAQSTQQLIEHAMGQRTLGPPLQQVSVSVEESIEIPAASAEIAPPSFIPIQPTTPSFLQSNFDDPIEKNENVELFARDSVSVSANSESSASKTSTEESTDSESIASVESSASQPTGENNTKPTIDAPNTRKVFQSRRNRRPAPLEFRGGSSSGGEMNPTFDYLTAAASPQHSTQSSEQPVQAFGWENSFDSSHSPQYRAEVLSQQSSSVDVSNNADTYTGVMGSSPSPSSGLPSGMSFNNAAVARSANFFVRSKTAEEKRELVRATSEFGHLPGWTLKSFIVKSGDDLRKEMLAMQLIEYVQKVFTVEGLDILLRPYQIICTGSQTGLIEFLEDTKSIDRIKKSFRSDPSDGSAPLVPALKDYFEFCFGPSYTFVHSQAVNNFVRSLVGYSLITYVLQVKDRHNANILVDNSGSLIHIDFGFILGGEYYIKK